MKDTLHWVLLVVAIGTASVMLWCLLTPPPEVLDPVQFGPTEQGVAPQVDWQGVTATNSGKGGQARFSGFSVLNMDPGLTIASCKFSVWNTWQFPDSDLHQVAGGYQASVLALPAPTISGLAPQQTGTMLLPSPMVRGTKLCVEVTWSDGSDETYSVWCTWSDSQIVFLIGVSLGVQKGSPPTVIIQPGAGGVQGAYRNPAFPSSAGNDWIMTLDPSMLFVTNGPSCP